MTRSVLSLILWTSPIIIWFIFTSEYSELVQIGGAVLNFIGFLEGRHSFWARG